MSGFSVRKPYTVLVGVVLAIVLGIVSFTKTTTDLLPNISLPYVIVVTTYPGANPESVEAAVTQPVEASMATVSNIESIQSVSSDSYSMVVLEFAQSTNMDTISLEIREKLDQIKAYWDDTVGNPMIIKLNPNMLPVMIAAVGMDGMDDAQVASYVKDEVMPTLESIEGVASASASGLLEKSVHVVIRKEKVDQMNEKIRGAIDKKMEDAEKELADGRQKIEDGQKELDDGKQGILDGQQQLLDGQQQLQDGKEELAKKQEETLAQLAATKSMLLTAKAQLEATKVTMTLAKGVVDPLMTQIQDLEKRLQELEESLAQLVNNEDDENDQEEGGQDGEEGQGGEGSQGGEEGQDGENGQDGEGGQDAEEENHIPQNLEELRAEIWQALMALRDQILQSQFLWDAAQQNPALLEAMNYLQSIDPDAEPATLLQAIKNTLQSLQNTLNTTMKTIETSLGTVNQGLEAVEKGELTAAIEFANASASISLGEYQMELGKTQLDQAQQQLEAGQEQLDQALEQLEEGQKQLEEARESAYEQADMANILTISTIEGLLIAQNFAMPAGYVTEEGVSYLIRVGDKPGTVEELQAMPLIDLHMDGVDMVTLEDVADVFYTDNSDSIYTNVNGSAGVILSLQKQTGYSTGDVSDRLNAKFNAMMKAEPGLHIIPLMDQGIYIDIVMDSIVKNIIFGAGLAILILLLFLRDLRPTMIVAFSIPISLVTAIVCMHFSGVTLNVISLSGLALGIGMLVDNSIVVIENIYRLRGEGASMKEAAIEGAKEVAGAIMASTLTTVCVFLPIVFTEGITRQLFVDMGLTIAFSLFASLAVALTVVPAMASKVLTGTSMKKETKFFELIIKGYGKVLSGALKVKPLVFILALALLGLSAYAAYQNGTAFMPEMDSTQMTVNVQLEDSATLADTSELTDQVVEMLLEMDDITDVGAMQSSGSSIMGMLGGSGAENAATIYVVTKEEKKSTNEELAAQIMQKTEDLPAEISVETSSMDMSALGGSGITIQVRGRDLDMLRKIAKEVAEIVSGVEGTENVSDGLAETGTELRIHVKKEEAVKYGLTVAQVFTQVMQKVAAANASTVFSGSDQDYNVYVSKDTDSELTRALIKELEISGTGENQEPVKVKLSEIADFEDEKSLDSINRVDQTRCISVTAQIADGYNVGKVSDVLEGRLKGYTVPEGYRLEMSGENETINDALGQLYLMLLLAVIFMYLIMVAQFQSLLSPFIIMFTIPLAFTGGFLALYFTGSELSVVAMVGFVMLSGIIVNNGIVIIDYMNQLREGGMTRKEAILTAGKTRLRPVLMTAMTTILALSTMVFSTVMGSALGRPMALVTIGGLTYGTLLTLIVIPCVYDVFAKGADKRKEKKSKNSIDRIENIC
ncbi:MAG: efflux RND transporter permease subunit [Lachnospiraceae bacterium]|nr:efflux RND transporter permease subunit [Lachnospiraceae bacterium]